MKKVLILAYDFPPYVSVGALRPYSWYKYLSDFKIYPIVVTRQWDNKYGNHMDYIAPSKTKETIIDKTEKGTIIKAPYIPNLANRLMLNYGESKYTLLRRAISAFFEFAQFIFFVGPKLSIYKAAAIYLQNNKVDIIIATGEPFILFRYASILSKKYNTPWIADYRDPWSQKNAIQKNKILKTWHSFFERKNLKNASKIITVSSFLQLTISTLIKKKDFFILPNGFDPEAIEYSTQINQQNNFLSIAYAGTIYKWHPITSFLSVISDLIKENNKMRIRVNLYGINIEQELRQIILKDFPNLKKHINIYPKTVNNILLKQLAKDNLMLLFNDYSISGTKIYDYIGINRKILLCYTEDKEAYKLKNNYFNVNEFLSDNTQLQVNLIEKTNSGYIIKNPHHLKVSLTKLYAEFLSTGRIICNTKYSENFSRLKQVEKLAKILEK